MQDAECKSAAPSHRARPLHEPLKIVVSTPEFGVNGEKVMEFILSQCQRHPDLLKIGFDWASSGNSYPDDAPLWEEFAPLGKKFFQTRGTQRAEVLQQMTLVLGQTRW